MVKVTDGELKEKRQRALELKQFLLDNKVGLISFLLAKTFLALQSDQVSQDGFMNKSRLRNLCEIWLKLYAGPSGPLYINIQ